MIFNSKHEASGIVNIWNQINCIDIFYGNCNNFWNYLVSILRPHYMDVGLFDQMGMYYYTIVYLLVCFFFLVHYLLCSISVSWKYHLSSYILTCYETAFLSPLYSSLNSFMFGSSSIDCFDALWLSNMPFFNQLQYLSPCYRCSGVVGKYAAGELKPPTIG